MSVGARHGGVVASAVLLSLSMFLPVIPPAEA